VVAEPAQPDPLDHHDVQRARDHRSDAAGKRPAQDQQRDHEPHRDDDQFAFAQCRAHRR
jgi:hypothetical protein